MCVVIPRQSWQGAPAARSPLHPLRLSAALKLPRSHPADATRLALGSHRFGSGGMFAPGQRLAVASPVRWSVPAPPDTHHDQNGGFPPPLDTPGQPCADWMPSGFSHPEPRRTGAFRAPLDPIDQGAFSAPLDSFDPPLIVKIQELARTVVAENAQIGQNTVA